jgi:hypothetical protein
MDAQPLVNCLAIMMVAFGLIAGARVYAATLPYQYSVQCKAPSDGQSRIILTSRRTGLTTVGPVPDTGGAVLVTSDYDHDYYEITLENSPCRHVESR